jgi:predicted nuclease with TOPRIM domain
MEMNDYDDFVKRVKDAIADMESFLTKGGASTTSVVREARDAAGELLNSFDKQLQSHQEETLALREENKRLKREIGDIQDMKVTVAGMNDQLEKMRRDNEKLLRERNEALEETKRLQTLWDRVNR